MAMVFWVSSVIHLGLGELCLLALFLFGIVLLVLLVRPPLGGYQFLVVLLIWLLLVLVLCRRLSLIVVVGRFSGLVVLVQDGKEFDLTEQPLHTSLVSLFNLSHVCGKDCIMWGFEMFFIPGHKRRRRDQDDEEYIPAQVRTGVG